MSAENWEKMRQLIEETNKANREALLKAFQTMSGSSKEEIHVETAHKTLEEILNCPTCKPKLKDTLKEEILKGEKERIKQLKNAEICQDCGEVYEGEEKDECPTCGKGKSWF